MTTDERDDQSERPARHDERGAGGRTPHAERPPHQPVLLEEALEWLAPRAGMTIVDCTVGAAGHSLAVLPRLLPDGQLVAIDRDADALALARQRLREFSPQVHIMQDNFAQLPQLMARLGIPKVHGVIADLGLSSLHVDDADRGFSFLKDGPLDMRMDQRQPTTAASLIQRLPEQDLATLIRTYGEERWARRIARRIVRVRQAQPITTTTQLARLVAEAVPVSSDRGRIHPATRTFQALRMVVNKELSSLEALLAALPEVLLPGGRAVLIAFHSLEDRLVKHAFRRQAQSGQIRLLTKSPVRPSDGEVARNPRSRSAKLRAMERLA